MIVILSPSKTLDFESPARIKTHTQPEFLNDSAALIRVLRGISPAKLERLMAISPKLAALNTGRYKAFSTPFTPENARQALLAFKGDVYEGMQVAGYGKADFAFAQQHLRILSGLYGLLRPLDLIQPYRLEMGTKLSTWRGKDLYAFWGERLTQALNAALAAQKTKVLVNLASEEYFKAVERTLLEGELITVHFKEKRKGGLKTVGLFAKRARGLMADFIIRHRLDDVSSLQEFRAEGYRFEAAAPGSYLFGR